MIEIRIGLVNWTIFGQAFIWEWSFESNIRRDFGGMRMLESDHYRPTPPIFRGFYEVKARAYNVR